MGLHAIADARRDGDRRRRGRGQAGDAEGVQGRRPCRRRQRSLRQGVRSRGASSSGRVRFHGRNGNRRVWQPKTGKHRTGYLRASTVRRLDAWRAEAGIESGPLFPAMNRWGRVKSPVRAMQPRAAADAIRAAAKLAGLRASGHSLRVGAAVSMASRGASLVAMQQAGGWKAPDMPAHYGRQASVRRGPVATMRAEDRWA